MKILVSLLSYLILARAELSPSDLRAGTADLDHRQLHSCALEMATQERVQEVFESSCTVGLNGVDDCVVTIPDSILDDFKQECDDAGGAYVGIAEHETNFYASVCNQYAGMLCSTYDSSTCAFVPWCVWTGWSCGAGSGNCIPVQFEFLFQEKPFCIAKTCDCLATASEIVQEEMIQTQQQVTMAYAELGNPTWAASRDFDRGNTVCLGFPVDDPSDDGGTYVDDPSDGVTFPFDGAAMTGQQSYVMNMLLTLSLLFGWFVQ